MRLLRIAALCLALLPGLASMAEARRVALVIGNADYEYVEKLPNPVNDARDIGAALARIGFAVTQGFDLDHTALRLALRDFAEEAAGADVALIYFAGHGIEIDNTNYLIPVNARLRRDRDVEFEAIRLDAVVDALADARGLKIVLVDACRNNPFVAEMMRSTATRSIGRGLARIEPGGVLVGYAARGGTLALDGEGRNSPYAAALLRHIEEPGVEIGKLFRLVRDTVFDMTGGDQEPFTYGSLPGQDFFLVPAAAPAAGAQPAVSAAELRMVEDFAKVDAAPSLRAWTGFLETYAAWPDHGLVRRAAARRDALQAAQDAARREAERMPWLDTPFDNAGHATALTREDRALIQRALIYMGHDVGRIDGEFGPVTLRAISAARFREGLSPGTHVDVALLRNLPDPRAMDALKSPTARIYRPQELPEGIDPRLRKAIESLGPVPIRFDYFEGRIYIAVLDRSRGWRAASQTARLAGGHLVTISSARENQFVVDLFMADPRFIYEHPEGWVDGPLIGLFQVPGSPEPRGGWTWETGEPVTFTAWAPGQPDNWRGNQNFAAFWRPANLRGTSTPPRFWDDVTGSPWGPGYIMEIE